MNTNFFLFFIRVYWRPFAVSFLKHAPLEESAGILIGRIIQ